MNHPALACFALLGRESGRVRRALVSLYSAINIVHIFHKDLDTFAENIKIHCWLLRSIQ